MGDPTHAVWPWPWCWRHSRAPHGQFTTHSCVRQERSPARPFLRFPGKACLWEGRKLAAGSVWDTNTWKPFLCQRFDAWGGQSPPALGGLAPRCGGLWAGLQDSPQRAMPGTWPQNGMSCPVPPPPRQPPCREEAAKRKEMSCSDSSFPPGRWVAELSAAREHPAAGCSPGPWLLPSPAGWPWPRWVSPGSCASPSRRSGADRHPGHALLPVQPLRRQG